jgi:predicted Zn finger-like uncharacterized protein
MVIQCPHCQAPFKLPQNKVKPGGTKVRCTKCKIIFMVTPPQQGDAASATTADRDFEADRETGFVGDFAEGFEASDFFSDGDEGDEFLLGQESAEDEDPFFGSEDPEFDQQEALTWSEEKADPFALDDTGQEEDQPSSAESLPPLFEDPVAEEEVTEEEPAEVTLALAIEDEPKNDDALADLADEESFFGQASSRMPLPAPRPPAESRKHFPWGGLWLLMLLVLLAGGGYAYYARHQLSASWQQLLIEWQLIPVPPPEGRALKPVKLTGYFVSNRREGRLFVIQGQVLNGGAEARAAIVVQGTVYDRSGEALAQQNAFCGNPMGKQQLRAWSMLRMAERMQNQFGEMLANLNLAPQKSIPFTLVFKDLPGEVAEFEVTVLDSEPVIK